jgi:hypothetical protein
MSEGTGDRSPLRFGLLSAVRRLSGLAGAQRRRNPPLHHLRRVAVATLLASTLIAAWSSETAAASASPVGTYSLTVTCSCGTFNHILTINSFDPATGAISGTNTNPTGTVTGAIDGSNISMTVTCQDGSGYVANLVGTISANGSMSGTGSDNLNQSWTWTAVPPRSCLGSDAYRSAVLANTPVSYWRLDETSGQSGCR